MSEDSSVVDSVRRQVVIDRHRVVISEMETNIGESFINGTYAHPRLLAMLRALDEESEQNKLHSSVAMLLKDPHFADQSLPDALIDLLCLKREEHETQIAELQLHAVGVYRCIRDMIMKRRCWCARLEDLRALSMRELDEINRSSGRPSFGNPDISQAMQCPPKLQQVTVNAVRQLRHLDDVAERWWDDGLGDAIPDEFAARFPELSGAERERACRDAVSDLVRTRFYEHVFCEYFSIDEFDVHAAREFNSLLGWLQAIQTTPQLFPFMQGQSPQQKNFRLTCLTTKILQLGELYQRLGRAKRDETLGPQLTGLSTRDALRLLAKAKYPPLSVDTALITSTFQYPLLGFVDWLQLMLTERDFVLPPEPRRKPGNGGSSRLATAAIPDSD